MSDQWALMSNTKSGHTRSTLMTEPLLKRRSPSNLTNLLSITRVQSALFCQLRKFKRSGLILMLWTRPWRSVPVLFSVRQGKLRKQSCETHCLIVSYKSATTLQLVGIASTSQILHCPAQNHLTTELTTFSAMPHCDFPRDKHDRIVAWALHFVNPCAFGW